MRVRVLDELEEVTTHDLVQPLAAIRLQSDLLAQRLRQHRIARRELLAGLDKISAHAGALADQLAAQLAWGDEDSSTIHRTACDLASIVRSVVGTLDAQSAARVVLAAPGSVPGEWDPERIAQVVRNLIGNALKYSGPDGVIRVAVRRCERSAELDVEDDGIGLDVEELSRLFSRGYRSPRVIASGIDGVGIGLSGCRAITEAHGGTIWAESEGIAAGARFRVRLPLSAA
jgi:signal transduction histidine kinase